jgi:hypothetical protein
MKISGKMNRRKFIKESAIVATTAGVAALIINSGMQSVTANTWDNSLKMVPPDTKEIFKKCGACSHTFFYLLNREFGYLKETEERASDPLAGGLMLGHQCGMLWGSSLAVGAESFRRNKNSGQAIASATTATQQLMESFSERAGSVNCRDITGGDITKKSGMVKLMLKIILHGGLKNSPCFKLADKWAPEAIQSATTGLSLKQTDLPQNTVSCASEVVRRMGGSDEEMVMVAGFAGGLGLKGNACGALGATIWMKTLAWCKEHPGESPFKYGASIKPKILEAFYSATGSEILCQRITGQTFKTINDHTSFLKNGGCNKLINVLSDSSNA